MCGFGFGHKWMLMIIPNKQFLDVLPESQSPAGRSKQSRQLCKMWKQKKKSENKDQTVWKGFDDHNENSSITGSFTTTGACMCEYHQTFLTVVL